jgi:hypothetical protein
MFAPTCFGPSGPSSGSLYWALLKLQFFFMELISKNTSLYDLLCCDKVLNYPCTRHYGVRGGAEVWLHSFLTTALDGGECSKSQRCRFTPEEITPELDGIWCQIFLVSIILVQVSSGRAADSPRCTNMHLSKFTGRVFFYNCRPNLTVMWTNLTAELWLVQIIHSCKKHKIKRRVRLTHQYLLIGLC